MFRSPLHAKQQDVWLRNRLWINRVFWFLFCNENAVEWNRGDQDQDVAMFIYRLLTITTSVLSPWQTATASLSKQHLHVVASRNSLQFARRWKSETESGRKSVVVVQRICGLTYEETHAHTHACVPLLCCPLLPVCHVKQRQTPVQVYF